MSRLPLPSRPVQHSATAQADSNIALAKYWGKRDVGLNLPYNSSLSIGLKGWGTTTTVSLAAQDSFTLNDKKDSQAAERLFAWVNRLVGLDRPQLSISSTNRIPTSAGLASSASGFAAATCALNTLFGWQLDRTALSGVARLGSGSAARSLFEGFVIWHRGCLPDGSDSVAQPLAATWQDLVLVIVEVSADVKSVGSTTGMLRTVKTSPLYEQWVPFAEQSVDALTHAIQARDFECLGRITEHNALTMHATMHSAQPTVNYWLPDSIAAMQTVWQLREQGVAVFFTMDAGPNLKLLCLSESLHKVQSAFPQGQLVYPFLPHNHE